MNGRPVGRPALSTTRWLQDRIALNQFHRDLYGEWLRRYEAEHGFAPIDAKRSFRAAVTNARKRWTRAARQDAR